MSLIDILQLKNKGMISLVGAGGKTTTMFTLGKELKKAGYRVLITTTTAIGEPEKIYDNYYIGEIDKDFKPRESSITIYADSYINKKIRGGNTEYLNSLYEEERFDFIIIEADGANMLPLKAPNKTEPVIPSKNSHTIGIIGIDSLGKKIKDTVHRPELFLKIIQEDNPNAGVKKEDIIKLILDEEGIFKNSVGEKIVFINKACCRERLEEAKEIRRRLETRGYKDKIFVTNILTREYC